MEPTTDNEQVLHHLALIYIALAHSTDEQLSEEEVNAIAERLRGWQHIKTETVLAALKKALDEYTQDGAEKQVLRSIDAVREALPIEQRRLILDDLMEIAMADDRFLFRESSFIGNLAQVWELRLANPEEEKPWSLLREEGRADNWSLLHDLALIYITLAQCTGASLTEAETDTIAKKINEWVPSGDEEDIREIIQTALTVVVQGPDERLFAESVDAVKMSIPAHQRSALLDDLLCIATADGEMDATEHEMIERLNRAWSGSETASAARS